MPATQISFSSFAASLLASVQSEPVDCTPPIVAAHAPASVVAHGGDVGGECIPFAGEMLDSKTQRSVLIPAKLAGMFASPVGAWVHPQRFKSGAVWFRPVGVLTRQGVLTSERRA